jgi:hypothetical protein
VNQDDQQVTVKQEPVCGDAEAKVAERTAVPMTVESTPKSAKSRTKKRDAHAEAAAKADIPSLVLRPDVLASRPAPLVYVPYEFCDGDALKAYVDDALKADVDDALKADVDDARHDVPLLADNNMDIISKVVVKAVFDKMNVEMASEEVLDKLHSYVVMIWAPQLIREACASARRANRREFRAADLEAIAFKMHHLM